MSIVIRPNTTNQIALTLNETSSLMDGFYQFEFINTFNTTSVIWSPLDTSNSCRYNLFTLIESSSGSTTGGTGTTLSLEVGRYTYNVREATGQTLSISATTGAIIETGVMNVMSTNIFTNNISNIYI